MIHMKHETSHLSVHGLRDNTYRETTNEIPSIISHVMAWFHNHADKSFKLKCVPAASEMFKILVESNSRQLSTVTAKRFLSNWFHILAVNPTK